MTIGKYKAAEKYFFLTLVALNTIPVLLYKFFPTLDGVAHLYNSSLINALLFDNNQLLNSFYVLNDEIVPNWIGHFILSFFNLFLPAFIAEKILLLFYVISLPLSFRILIRTISPNNYLFSYFIFPFTYSFVFFLGFYNFSLSLVFLLITLNYWIKNENNLLSVKRLVCLSLLIITTYFSHIFIFVILIYLIILYIIINGFIEWTSSSDKFKKIAGESIKKIGFLIVSSALPLFLFFIYFTSRSSGDPIYIEHAELIEWLKNIRPIIALHMIKEGVFTEKIFYIFLALLVIVIYKKINAFNYSIKIKSLSTICKFNRTSFFWLFALISILILYFKMPDSDGTAGYVSVRLGLLFFIFLIIWFSTQKISKKFTVLLIIVNLYCNFRLNFYYLTEVKHQNEVAVDCYNASEHILPNSVILPLNYSKNWLQSHFSNYLGIDKPMVILENYESGTGYFPVNWNEKSIPNTLLGIKNNSQPSCISWKTNETNPTKEIDYVFTLGDIASIEDSCNLHLMESISENYTLIYQTENCKLYRRNFMPLK